MESYMTDCSLQHNNTTKRVMQLDKHAHCKSHTGSNLVQVLIRVVEGSPGPGGDRS